MTHEGQRPSSPDTTYAELRAANKARRAVREVRRIALAARKTHAEIEAHVDTVMETTVQMIAIVEDLCLRGFSRSQLTADVERAINCAAVAMALSRLTRTTLDFVTLAAEEAHAAAEDGNADTVHACQAAAAIRHPQIGDSLAAARALIAQLTALVEGHQWGDLYVLMGQMQKIEEGEG